MKRRSQSIHALCVLFFSLTLLASCSDEGSTDSLVENRESEYLSEYEGPEAKWGFIDKRGQVAIRPRYDQVSAFSEGLAAVNHKGKWGYIDKTGDIVIDFQFLAAWSFVNGYARVETFVGGQCFIDKSGRSTCPEGAIELGDISDGFFQIMTSGGDGFVDLRGEILLDPIFDRTRAFYRGYAVAYRGDQARLIDTMGNTVLEGAYTKIHPPSNGLICVQGIDGYQFLDVDSGASALGSFERAVPFETGITAVKAEGMWRLMDTSGSFISESFDRLRPAGNNRWVATRDKLSGLLNNEGNALSDFKYDQINNFQEGLAAYQKNGLCGFMDMQGREVIPAEYGLAWDFHEGLARAAFRDGIAYIDRTGAVPFIPEFYEIRDFSEGYAPFQEN